MSCLQCPRVSWRLCACVYCRMHASIRACYGSWLLVLHIPSRAEAPALTVDSHHSCIDSIMPCGYSRMSSAELQLARRLQAQDKSVSDIAGQGVAGLRGRWVIVLWTSHTTIIQQSYNNPYNNPYNNSCFSWTRSEFLLAAKRHITFLF